MGKYHVRPFYIIFVFTLLVFLRYSQALQLTTGWTFVSLNSSAWTEPRPIDPGPRAGSSSWVTKEGTALLFGGRGIDLNSSSATLLADLWGYNSTSDTWIRFHNDQQQTNETSTSDPTGREMSAMCGSKQGDRVVVFGGRMNHHNSTTTSDTCCTATNQLLVFNISHNRYTWQIHSNSDDSPSPRFGPLYWCDEQNDQMRLVGGRGSDGQLIDDAWKLHLSNLTWVPLKSKQNESDTGLHAVDNSALLWKLADGRLYLMRDKIEQTDSNISDFIVQLWKLSSDEDSWMLINESNQGRITWPGVHRHGGTCTDLHGNLWLFNGESEIDGQLYLNNDLWFYNVTSNVWSKVELTSSQQPEQRHMSVTWCHRDTMFTYGGYSCTDTGTNAECLLGNTWKLDIQTTNDVEIKVVTTQTTANHSSKPSGDVSTRPPPVLKLIKQKPKHKIVSNAIPHLETTTNVKTTVGILGSTSAPFHTVDEAPSSAVLNRMLNQPNRADQSPSVVAVDQDESSNHGVYGSAIFFGISITMFSLFGLVVFFRRCVSCPPRENLLLKEPPPVRYTVIPDDSYSI